MTVVLEVTLQHRPLERLEGDLLVAGFFCEDRPLKGAAGRADWRLCGLVSRILLEGDCSGREGEAILVSCQGRLRMDRVLFLGLGERDCFDAFRGADRTRDAVQRALELGAKRLVLEPLGIRAEDFSAQASSLMQAVLAPLRRRSRTLQLDLLVPEAERGRADSALRKVIAKHAPGEAALRGKSSRNAIQGNPAGLPRAL